MSRKIFLIVISLLLLFMLACEMSAPATLPPSTTQTLASSATSTEEAYPAPPANTTQTVTPQATSTEEAYPAPLTSATVVAISTDTPLPPTTTDAPSPTFTVTNSPTSIVPPSITPEGSLTPIPYPYSVQEGCPVYMPNFAHPDAACNWLGIAGQIFDPDQVGIKNLVVIAGGTLDGNPIDILQMTGSAPDYGAGGYELVLSSTVVASEGTIWIQVKDLAGTPLTSKIYIDTHEDCAQNLLLLNFVQQ